MTTLTSNASGRWDPDFPAVLSPADLRLAFFDRATQLKDSTLGNTDQGYVRVADTRWGEVNLAVVDWGDILSCPGSTRRQGVETTPAGREGQALRHDSNDATLSGSNARND